MCCMLDTHNSGTKKQMNEHKDERYNSLSRLAHQQKRGMR